MPTREFLNAESKVKKFLPYEELGIVEGDLAGMVESAKKGEEGAPIFLASDLFIKGNDASMRGDVQTAILLFKSATQLQPRDFYLKRKLAFELIRSGDLLEAEKILSEVYRQETKKDETTGLILASVYSSLEKHKEARLTYQDLLSRNPASEEACLYLSRSYAIEKLYKEAHSLLAACEKRAHDNPMFSFYRGRMEYEQGNKNMAKTYFENALKKDGTFAQAALAIGALYEEKENFLEALKVYQKFVANEANATNAQVLSRLVSIMFSLEKNVEIIPFAETLSSLDNSDLNLKVRLGLLYTDSERYEEAKKLFKDVLEIVPDSDKVLYYLGALTLQTNQKNEALSYFKKIGKTSPLYGDAGLQMGQILGSLAREEHLQGKGEQTALFHAFVESRYKENPEMGIELKMLQASFFEDIFQYKNAIAVLNSIKEHKKFTEGHRYFLASILEKNGEYAEARKLVQIIVDKDPNNAHALNFLGYSFLEKNEKLETAYEYISKAVSLRPEDGYIRDSLAWYFYQTGKFQEALHESKKASELVKGDPTITKHLGMIYQSLHHYDKAKEYLTEALRNAQVQSEKEDVLRLLEDVEKGRLPASRNP